MKLLRPGTFVMVVSIGWFYWRVLRPLRKLSHDAQALSEGNLAAFDQRDIAAPELVHLRSAMRAMAGHVQRAQTREKSYVATLTSGQEAERGRIARELHDETTQSLIAIAQTLEVARDLIGPDTPASALLTMARTQAIEAVDGLRVLIANLRPPSLAELGLVPALKILTERPSSATITLNTRGTIRRLNEVQELALFRAAQEAISNAQRHGHATHIQLHINYTPASVEMVIQDNGVGFTPTDDWMHLSQDGHYGLVGMHERIQLLDGLLELDSRPGRGTTVKIVVPLRGTLQPGNLVRDPVCSVEIQPSQAYSSVDYLGTRYYFCCPVCQGSFQADPDFYVPKETDG